MKHFLAVCLCLMVTVSFSQEAFNAEGELNKMIQTPNSPEASSFGGYGSIPVNLRTGTPNISVPLYTYKGLEMDLPMSLTYDIHARKVEGIASGVGLGWNLNLGGRVVRNVNGLADNYLNVTASGGYSTLYKSPTLRAKYLKFYQKQVTENPAPGSANTFDDVAEVDEYYQFLDRTQTNAYDLALDSHSISAPGLSDRVIMHLDDSDPNNPIIAPVAMNDPKLEFTQWDDPNSVGNVTFWQVTDGTGTTYYFEDHEITKTFNGLDTSHPSQLSSGPTAMTYISSWLLTKIVSPNGKDTYEFSYVLLEEWKQDISTWENQRVDFENPHTNQWDTRYVNAGSTYNIIQKALKTVKHNDEVIIDITLSGRDDIVGEDNNGLANKIEKVTVKSPLGGSTVSTFRFTHSLFGPTNWSDPKEIRLKLDKVEIGGEGSYNPSYDYEREYSFDYHQHENMPPRDSFSQDVFGYYNGESNSELFPAPENGQPSVPNPEGGDRSFSFNHAKIGILTHIHYPTGGHSEFIYEEHLGGNAGADGIRIASIENYSDNSTLETKKTFEYLDQHLDGFALPDLAYTRPRRYFHNSTIYTVNEHYRSAKGAVGDQPYVTYGKVVERDINTLNNNSELGYTEHVFYNYDSTNDATGTRTLLEPPFASEYFTHASQGQLKEQYVYDHSGNLLSQSSNELDTDSSFYDIFDYESFTVKDNGNRQLMFPMKTVVGNDIVVSYVPAGPGSPPQPPSTCTEGSNTGCLNQERYARIQPLRLYNRLHRSKKTKGTSQQHLDGGTVTTQSTTRYDPNNFYLTSESESTTSDSNETLVTKYLYPKDLSDPHMQDLIDDNRIASPVQTETYLREGSDELLATQKTLFQSTGGRILPQSVQVSRRNDTPETRVQFEAYDSQGNPVQVKKANGTPTAYIWGYGFRLPVAKIENATYAQISAIGTFDLSGVNTSTSSSYIAGEIDELRQALTGSMVTTYLYNPQMMVEKITDPRNYTTTFHYDGENRLEYVTDHDHKILSQNEYNYRLNN